MTTAMVERAAAAPSVRFSYGSIAFPLPGRRAAPEHTHRWSVFVRGADNGDLTHAVSRVVFTLHESFAQPVRELSSPPFVVTETGWGVFDVGIDVYLRDPAAPPIRLVHALRLFPDGGAPPAGSAGAGGPSAGGLGGGPPVVAETYDELVFNELPADAAARAALLRGPGRDAPPPPDAGPYLGGWGDGEDLAAIAAARAWVAERSDELRDRLAKGKAEHAMLTAQLGALGTI